MKTLTLTLNLRFSEKVNTDEDINEIGENVRKAIAHAADTAGIAPEGSDWYLKEFSITCPWNNLEILHSVDGANNKSDKIKYIKDVLATWGATSCAERELDHSPCKNSIGDGKSNVSELIEQFDAQGVSAITYNDEIEIGWNDYNYEDLEEYLIDEIYEIIRNYESDMLK
jgi:hypothetical protein